MKKFLIILIIIFICGLLSADVCLKQIQDSSVFPGMDFYEQYATSKMVFKDVFWSVLYERIKLFAVLIMLCFMPVKERLALILAPIFCFGWGFFLMSCIVELGIAGVVIGLASVIPHGILYGLGIGLILRTWGRRYHIKKPITRNIATGLFIVLLFVAACVVESLIGTHFIPWVIRLSMV